MAQALDEHGTVAHPDHQDQGEREQAQGRPDGRSQGEASGQLLGESYRCHIGRGFPHRTNVGLRARRQRLTRRARCGRSRPAIDFGPTAPSGDIDRNPVTAPSGDIDPSPVTAPSRDIDLRPVVDLSRDFDLRPVADPSRDFDLRPVVDLSPNIDPSPGIDLNIA
jgi:hypothetical protein